MIRALWVTIITFGYILVVGPPLLIYAVLTRNTDPLYQAGLAGVRMVLWLAGVRLEIRGLEKIPKGQPVVFMPNHQSNSDPPAVFAVIPPVLIMAKKEFFRIPVLGRAMILRGFIPVDRKNHDRAVEAVEEAAKSLIAGHSFLLFPEGTRSKDGRLQPFKKGGFVMAIKAGAPIIPISISGSSRVMRKGEFAIRPGVVRVTIHDAVPTEGLTIENRDRLLETVRQAILSGLAREEWPVDHPAKEDPMPSQEGIPTRV